MTAPATSVLSHSSASDVASSDPTESVSSAVPDPTASYSVSAPATSGPVLSDSSIFDLIESVSYAMSDPVASFSATGPEVESTALQNELNTINLSDLERLTGNESLLDTSGSQLDTSGSLLDTSGALETINLSHLAVIIQVDTATISCNTINPIAAAAQDLIDSDLSDGENELENEPAVRHIGVTTRKLASHLKMRVSDKLNLCFIC